MLISWDRYHGRSEALSRLLGLECVFVYPSVQLPGPRLISTAVRYLLSALTTTARFILARRRDRSVVVVAPPVFPVLLGSLVLKPGRMVIDAHSGALAGDRWMWSTPLLRWSCRRAAALIVTNTEILKGRDIPCQVVVMHDPFEDWGESEAPGSSYVLIPLGGGDDEPVETIMEAVRACDIPFVFSGRSSPSNLPDNARAVGFVSSDDYRELVERARVVVGMTKRDFTMQRVGYEALFAERALVTADFDVLRRFFEKAAVYVRPEDPGSMADGIQTAWRDADTLADRMHAVRRARSEEQAEAVATLRRLVERPGV